MADKKTNENMRYYTQSKTVPGEAQKPIHGGRLKGMTDINPMWRIKQLTEMFGPVGIGWYYKIVDKHIEPFGNEAAAFVDIELYYKENGEWSMPIYGTGGSSFVTIENSGKAYMSDECFKMALTDAISIACKALGFAADIYYSKDRTKYDNQAEAAEATPKAQPTEKKVTVAELEAAMKKKGVSKEDLFATYKRDTGKTCTDLKFIKAEYKTKYFNMCK